MLYYLCRVINVTASLLYPTYASYKALKATPASSRTSTTGTSTVNPGTAELERWTQYWCVMGVMWIYQDWVEWSFAWFPFYYEFKTLLILWIVLPQTQGSAYLYRDHLSPFLSSHESSIDDFVSSLSARLRSAGLSYLNQLVQSIRQAVLGGGGSGGLQNEQQRPVVLAEPGTVGGEAQTALGGVLNLVRWATREYGSNGAMLASNTLAGSLGQVGSSVGRGSDESVSQREAKLRRKRKLEMELAALSSETTGDEGEGYDVDDVEEEEESLLLPSSSSNSSSSSLRKKSSPTTLRKKTQPAQKQQARYVETQLGRTTSGGTSSLYEDLAFDAAELKDYPVLKPKSKASARGRGGEGGGWLGWGASASGAGEQGKGKRE